VQNIGSSKPPDQEQLRSRIEIPASRESEDNDWSPAEFIWQTLAGLHDHDDILVTMLKAYYDASGKKNLGRVSVAGWLSTARKWADFQIRWNEVLKQFDIPYFHASSFESGARPFDGDWKRDEQRRRDLIEQLAVIIRDTALFGVASTVYYADFDAAAAIHPEIRIRYKNPYVLAARDCMKVIDTNALKLRVAGKRASAAHIFEHGDEGMGRLVDLCREAGEGIPELVSSEHTEQQGNCPCCTATECRLCCL